MSYWANVFTEMAPGYDPRHIEAYVRLEYSTLGSMSRIALAREVNIAKQCVDVAGIEVAEDCARSFGL